MRLLVFGSRTYGVPKRKEDGSFDPISLVRARLQIRCMIDVLTKQDFNVLIQGGAQGADITAKNIVSQMNRVKNIEILEFKADWARYGKSAGPFRNRKMISEGKPDFALGFIDRETKYDTISPGSRNMLMQLQNNGIKVELFQ